MKLTVGLLVNPAAGLGGSVALKGSDGLADVAMARGAQPQAQQRALTTLAKLRGAPIRWLTLAGEMGATVCRQAQLKFQQLPLAVTPPTTARDTQAGAQALLQAGCDLLVFVGGDGTARDVLDAVGEQLVCLGIPAGVKMHSGVFSTSPTRAAALIERLCEGGLVSAMRAEVRDIDETALRQGQPNSRYYGELIVPELAGYLQATKVGGREDQALATEEIAQGVCERTAQTPQCLLLGPGGTLRDVKAALGLEPTLLGFDLWHPQGKHRLDLSRQDILDFDSWRTARLLVSFPHQQGVLFGRGNQQLSADMLAIWHQQQAIEVLATRAKLSSLEGNPLLVDSGSNRVDQALAGLWPVHAGFDDRLLYRVEAA